MPSRSDLRNILSVLLAAFVIFRCISSLDEAGQLYALMFALVLAVVGRRQPQHYFPAAFSALLVAVLISRTQDPILAVILCNLPLCFIFVAMRTTQLENEIAALRKELEQKDAARSPSVGDQAPDGSIRTAGATK